MNWPPCVYSAVCPEVYARCLTTPAPQPAGVPTEIFLINRQAPAKVARSMSEEVLERLQVTIEKSTQFAIAIPRTTAVTKVKIFTKI